MLFPHAHIDWERSTFIYDNRADMLDTMFWMNQPPRHHKNRNCILVYTYRASLAECETLHVNTPAQSGQLVVYGLSRMEW
jgi:hypothetical protein